MPKNAEKVVKNTPLYPHVFWNFSEPTLANLVIPGNNSN